MVNLSLSVNLEPPAIWTRYKLHCSVACNRIEITMDLMMREYEQPRTTFGQKLLGPVIQVIGYHFGIVQTHAQFLVKISFPFP